FDSFYLNNRGYVQNIIGDYDAALVSLYTAVELDPEMAYAHSNLGKTYLGLAELELAQRQLEIALTLDPEDPYTYHNFALLSAAKGDTISACEYLELAIQKNSSFILPIGKELKADHQRICR
ncbi:MAG: tetratricopeptide repeat protein, partial [Bacteroidota bacterium]